MSNWHPTNPVERRFMAVHDDWMIFATHSHARLMYWQTSEADRRMLDTYFQRQDRLSSAVLRLYTGFVDADLYAAALADEIVAWYEDRKATSQAGGVTADWVPPVRGRDEAATPYLLRITGSLMRHHPDVFPELVLILEPGRISKPDALERWLDTLLGYTERDAWQAARLRFVLTGTDAEALAGLRKRRPQQVMLLQGRYGTETLPRELVVESGQRGPQGDFLRLFVELNEVLERGDVARLERLRAEALTVTQQQRWFDQSVTVHLLVGAAWLKWNEPAQALAAYEQATQAAHQAIDAAHPAARKLAVNSLFGEASAYWMQGNHRHAAERYERAASFAEADRDGVLAVEAWRMVGECMNQMRRQEDALAANFRALDFGAWIDPALRANSNVQHVAQQALTRVGTFHRRRGELTHRLRILYGENWTETIKPLPPEAVTAQIMADMPDTSGPPGGTA
ncbi:hypothetical protein ACFQ3P_30205 [Paraburkholderia sabiae]|uniref:Tetratricopeptide repeat protein n=1 Tax=Paraburkholderia sabiae TaxID=273251 RepID=A0ABU9QNC8_9BURK|nr:tetratricopeptide repeat protein [Paraburkholderia sabiae]WJZ74910.1 tetratricopeptide repeat protein [Paraburkholderia sabiae]CAD6551400.1 hypothetical protein LMG24235_04929 [Paraburkholderia sabiae]